jgi:hypothetical protein
MRGFDRDFLRTLATAARAGKLVLGEVQHGDDVILPSPGQRAAVGQQLNIRSLNVYSESDDVVRRVPLMLAVGDEVVPSMSLELASRALGVAPQIGADQSITLAGYRIPTNVPNAMTLNFDGGSDDIPTYSFADLYACLEKGDVEFFRRNFSGKVVLFGSRLDFEDGKRTSKRFARAPSAKPAERCALPAGKAEPVVRDWIDAATRLSRSAKCRDGWLSRPRAQRSHLRRSSSRRSESPRPSCFSRSHGPWAPRWPSTTRWLFRCWSRSLAG